MRWRHRHLWEPRETFEFTAWDVKTRVLYVCEQCGKPRVKTIVGKWTIADLRSKREREKDLDSILEETPRR